jgi:hypothetical protein
MKTIAKIILTAAFACFLDVYAFAQTSMPGKVFVAEINGGVTFIVGGKVIELKKGQSVLIEGAHIETGPGANVVLVYSNGTSIYIDEKTIIDINRFVQKPFPAGADTTVLEPSASETIGRVSQGRVIITTNELATGTSMVYLTPESQVRVRGREVVIEVKDQETNIILLRGDVTVTPLNAPAGDIGETLQDGQMAIVTTTAAAVTAAATIQIVPAPQIQANDLGIKVAATERAQQTVIFETVTTPTPGGTNTTTDVQAKAIVPVSLPVQLTVSPSTLRTGG